MVTEQLIRQNQVRHQELLWEAEQARKKSGGSQESPLNRVLAGTGDLLVVAGEGLRRRYRRMEEGVALAEYGPSQRMGRAL